MCKLARGVVADGVGPDGVRLFTVASEDTSDGEFERIGSDCQVHDWPTEELDVLVLAASVSPRRIRTENVDGAAE